MTAFTWQFRFRSFSSFWSHSRLSPGNSQDPSLSGCEMLSKRRVMYALLMLRSLYPRAGENGTGYSTSVLLVAPKPTFLDFWGQTTKCQWRREMKRIQPAALTSQLSERRPRETQELAPDPVKKTPSLTSFYSTSRHLLTSSPQKTSFLFFFS